MQTLIRYTSKESGEFVDVATIIVDGILLQYSQDTDSIHHVHCTNSIEDYGISYDQFVLQLHTKGIKEMIIQYPDAFLTLGENRYVRTEVYQLENQLLQHEN